LEGQDNILSPYAVPVSPSWVLQWKQACFRAREFRLSAYLLVSLWPTLARWRYPDQWSTYFPHDRYSSNSIFPMNQTTRYLAVAALALLLLPGGWWKPAPGLAAPPEALDLPEFKLTDYRGREWTPADFKTSPLLVVAFMGTECPLAKLYAGRLAQLEKQFGEGIAVVAVVANKQDSLADIEHYVEHHHIGYPVLKDSGNRLADRMGAERTPEVFLFDGNRKLRYWGRIDDQYGIGYARDEPQQHDLKDAIVALQTGRKIAMPQTRSVGCIIGRTKPTDETASITFSNTVAPILQKRCVECHQDGEIAPFALTDYEEASGWADMIAETVEEGRMPPWHANPAHGEFANSREMTDAEKLALRQWADAGAPRGEEGANIKPPVRPDGWQLPREPDMIVPVSPQPIDVQATGTVNYQYFVVDSGLEEDVWLEAAELLPGNRSVVHHILCFARPKNAGGGLNAQRDFLVGYVPGARVEMMPRGMAKKIPAGSQLVFQVHYTPIGTPQQDHSQLGLVFADPESITHEVKTYSAVPAGLKIPPREPAHEVFASTELHDALLLGMSPHMHLRGKSFRYELESQGETKVLLDVPHYDFNWQTTYMLKEPLPIRDGDRMICTAVFDNSEANRHNPAPEETVRWGDQTDDEMMIGYFHYAVPRGAKDDDAESPKQEMADLIRRAGVLRVFERLDVDGDGQITREQTPERFHEAFDRMNLDGDNVLTRKEVQTSP